MTCPICDATNPVEIVHPTEQFTIGYWCDCGTILSVCSVVCLPSHSGYTFDSPEVAAARLAFQQNDRNRRDEAEYFAAHGNSREADFMFVDSNRWP